jgi:hypothetical protein
LESTALGFDAEAACGASTALGAGSVAEGVLSTAIGVGADAIGTGGTAVGFDAGALSANSTALGADANASGVNSTALGAEAEASGSHSTAVGVAASALGENSTAIGTGASAGHANAIARGANAATMRENQVAIGGASNTYTLGGIASAESLAAQSGPIQVVTADASGNLATDGGVLFDALVNISGDFAALSGEIDEVRNGLAMAIALDAPYIPPGQTFMLSSGLGFFEGSSAFALSGAYRVSDQMQLDGGIGIADEGRDVGARLGLTIGW